MKVIVACVVVMLSAAPGSTGEQPRPGTREERFVAEALRNVYGLRSYTVFDWISALYDRGTLTLQGLVRTPELKQQAVAAAGKSAGIDEVVDQLQVLPTLAGDDDIRVAAYIAIYGSSALERYAPGGQLSGAALDELRQTASFGLDGTDVGRGPHAIHILVSGARVILRGQVRTTGDRQIAFSVVRSLSGVLGVTNELRVPERQWHWRRHLKPGLAA